MTYRLFYIPLSFALIFLFCGLLAAQTKKQSFERLLSEVEAQAEILAQCRRGKVRISHFCYDLCPVNLRKPAYPAEAQRLRIKGTVKIEVIIDEGGKVIYAQVLEGKPYLSQSAREAAYRSEFFPARNCENKPIKFRGTIVYNFES